MHEAIIITAKRFVLAAMVAILAIPTASALDRRTLLQRLTFTDAENALKQGQLITYHRLAQQLQDYPLYPYLKFEEIKRNLRGNNQGHHWQVAYSISGSNRSHANSNGTH